MCLFSGVADGLIYVMSSSAEARKTLDFGITIDTFDFGISLSARPRGGDTLLMMILYE